MARGVYFNGKQRYKPGGYSKVDVSKATPIVLGAQRILAFVGEAGGGKPGSIMYFNDPTAAEDTLRSGDLLEAMKIAWSPSKTLPGADLIACIRVNPATTSTLSLQDSTPAAAVTLTSLDYGLWTTGIKAKVEAGSTSGKKVTISYSAKNVVEVYDNMADNDAIVKAINAKSTLVKAAKVSSVAVANVADTPLTGGVEGSTTTTEWNTALTALEQKRIHGLVPVTADATVHASFLAHSTLMADRQKARRIFCGHALEETKDAVLTRARNLSSHRAVQVTPGIKRNGKTLPAVFTAAAIAGMWAGAERTEPLTGDLIDCQGVEVAYSDATNDFADFINGGVLAIEDVDGVGYKVVHAITTHLADDNPVRMELMKDSLADEIDERIRVDLEKMFAGKGSVANAETSVYNRVITNLNKLEKDDGWIVAGKDDAGNDVPAYQNVRVTKQGTAFYAEYEASIIDPINFVLLGSRFTG